MKKFVLAFFTITIFAIVLTAQPCTPDPGLTTPGFSPDSITNLPAGQVGVHYEAVISALIPTDTVVSGVTAAIDSIGVVNVLGLPTGLSWTTNSPNNYWDGGKKGCMIIQGTTNIEGVHNLLILIRIHGKLGGMPMIVPDTIKFYKINMQQTSIGEEISGESFSVDQAFPNPASDITNIEVIVRKPSVVSFSLYNLVGMQMLGSKHELRPGKNTISVNVKQFPAGMYFYRISNGDLTITRKLNISN